MGSRAAVDVRAVESVDTIEPAPGVFSSERDHAPCAVPSLPDGLECNSRLKMAGLDFLQMIPHQSTPVVFFDPQYRGILDRQAYGNEGERQKGRARLPQMSDKDIGAFIGAIDHILVPSGHLFLWMDKFHLCTGFADWLTKTRLDIVDMVTWDKQRMGMGYRTRRMCEYLVILQQQPRRAKGVWKLHNIPDIWSEKVQGGNGVHPKPIKLQTRLIEAVSHPGDMVVDPAAGSFSVLEACRASDRHFLGCDING